MRNVYCYQIYGLTVHINLPMPLLTECSEAADADIRLDVSYARCACDGGIGITENDGLYTVTLSPYAVYTIDPAAGRFVCSAANFEAFFSTLFNIPFAVYFASRKERLLHTCSMLYERRLLCFIGEKGSGKSTLTKLLDGTAFQLYSDDTLRLAEDMLGYRAHNLIKCTDQTVTALRLQTTGAKNAVGKQYAYISCPSTEAPVSALIAVKRTTGSAALKKITSPLMQKALYCGNIVGAQYFPAPLLNQLFSESAPPLPCYVLLVPDGLSRLAAERQSLSLMLCEALRENDLIQS